jgi:hypothetical protein
MQAQKPHSCVMQVQQLAVLPDHPDKPNLAKTYRCTLTETRHDSVKGENYTLRFEGCRN